MAAICDGVDGYIARRYNQRSELGAILDPLADKLLLVSGIVLLSISWPYFDTIPLWLTCTIIGRDILILIGLKMLASDYVDMPTYLALAAVALVLAVSIVLSLVFPKKLGIAL